MTPPGIRIDSNCSYLDGLPDEKRREIMRLLVDQVLIKGANNVWITLAIPTEEFVSIEKEESQFLWQVTVTCQY